MNDKIIILKKRRQIIPKKKLSSDSRFVPFLIIGFFLIIILNIVNAYYRGVSLRTSVMAEATSGFKEISSAAKDIKKQNFSSAFDSFERAVSNFSEADSSLSLFENSGSEFAEAGKHVSRAGLLLTDALTSLSELPKLFTKTNLYIPSFSLAVSSETPRLTDKLHDEILNFKNALIEVKKAQTLLASSNKNLLPTAYQILLIQAEDQLKLLNKFISAWIENETAIRKLLGDTTLQTEKHSPFRYMILMQNKNELRATGGFIGSYLIVEVLDGYLTKFEPHDIYESDGIMASYHINPPADLKYITKEWRLRDANFSPDFPTSAEKILWFMEQEKSPKINAVIAIDQTVLARLLEITGPVWTAELSKPLDSKNFDLILQYFVESKLSGSTRPKQILFNFIPGLKDKLLTQTELTPLLSTIQELLNEKHIQAYSTDPEIQKFFENSNIDGSLTWTNEKEDYLNVTNISVGANKSDAFIKQSYLHETFLTSSGDTADALTIKKEHLFKEKDAEYIYKILSYFGFKETIEKGLMDVLGRGTNKSIVKVFVPRGSKLLRTEGISIKKIKTEFDPATNKQVFSFLIEIPAWQSKDVTLRYKLPFNLDFSPADTYRLLIEKQASTDNIEFVKKIYLTPVLQKHKTFPVDGWEEEDGNFVYKTILEGRSASFAFLLGD